MQKNERIRLFVQEIWAWYGRHKRILPWRDLTDADPTERAYKVLVSEIMLQQTQVPRVIIIYKNFLERFPTLHDLAEASNREVLIAWRGMGYNSRALRLRDAAKVIVESEKLKVKNDEIFPTAMEEWMAIPGIGHYTAAAIRNFAFGIPTPCIDTNIRRILHRTFVGPEKADGAWERDDEYLLKIAGEVLNEALRQKIQSTKSETNKNFRSSNFSLVSNFRICVSTTADWHAALMDFGSLVQTKKNPRWNVCPLTEKNIMRTTRKSYELLAMSYEKNRSKLPSLWLPPSPSGFGRAGRAGSAHRSKLHEPGRQVGGRFVPNRIFRGRVIEALRDAPRGLTLHDIGKRITRDWNPEEHREWLRRILKELQEEKFLDLRATRYALAE